MQEKTRKNEDTLIYLDACVLIAYYAVDEKEKDKKEKVLRALDAFNQADEVQLCTSMWAVAEMVNVLIYNKEMEAQDVATIESDFANERRLSDAKIKFVDVSPKGDYDFQEFFYHVRQGILSYHSGVADIIHSVIMRNNGIGHILTFDEKDDFKQIPDLTVINPGDIKLGGTISS
ncbi:type II toxin-antitoxin system VapC family toxin [Candidatus Falkowbacteria bacterium]|nr:type II toxin-antitoxin system VapC family toxin [Candidatus Falkowbacteria bacterium]